MLPSHLAISFPIWALHDTQGNGAYHDLDRMMAETVQRGFNCIRFDDGAGLIDFSSNPPNGVVSICEPYPGFSSIIRQQWCCGKGGPCDLLERLVQLMEAAKRHNVYVILSSWYYLHTFWYCGDENVNRRLHALPPHERCQFFAEQLDHILSYLRERDLLGQVAFAEILNEADGLNFVGGYSSQTNPEHELFRQDHEAAIAYLRQRHPDVLFAYDTYTAWTKEAMFPSNAQVWNFHSYYLWPIYSILEGKLLASTTDLTDPRELACAQPYLSEFPIPLQQIIDSRKGRLPGDWYRRIWLYNNLEPRQIPALEQLFFAKFAQERHRYEDELIKALEQAVALRNRLCPDARLVMAESCSYIGSYSLLWEEHCDSYWDMLEFVAKQFRKYDLWGAAIRTCSGCEDPSWLIRADDYRRINGILTAENL
ncbi:MAG: hypothetical protein J6X55_01475 [Victivallales bacterium]|nr:hypothetical protein [Victivallales bacterium]